MRFYTSGLLSKWGFGDGDMLDEMLWDAGIYLDDSHTLLIRIVRELVLPRIEQKVEVFEIGTIHNPIRADTVNGKRVDHCADDPGVPPLTPEFIEVPEEVILNLARSLIPPSPL